MVTAPRKIIRCKTVTERTGKSRVQIWRDVRAKRFPAPVDLGPNSIGWFEDEVASWMASRPRRTYGGKAETAKVCEAAELIRRNKEIKAVAEPEEADEIKADRRRRGQVGTAK